MAEVFGDAVDRGLLLMAASDRMRRTGMLLAGGMVATSLAKAGWSAYNTRRRWQVSLSSGEDLFQKASVWLLADLADVGGVHTRVLTDAQDRSVLRAELVFDRPVRLNVDGHWITASSELHEVPTVRSFPDEVIMRPSTLTFSGVGEAARDALMQQLDSLAARQEVPGVYVASRWGQWSRTGPLVPRSLDTVIVPGRDQLVADLQAFLDAREGYERLGVPWHRGYLLHGPSGTGKTSLALALAQHFNRDIYYLALSDLDRDTSLLGVVSEVSTRCILLIEDVDVVHAAKSRDDAESRGVSLAGLLNALDGVATPQGLVTIMTTNSVDVIDPALLRAGRVDMRLEVGYLDDEGLDLLLRRFLGEGLPAGRHVLAEVPAADVMEVVKSGVSSGEAKWQEAVDRFSA